MSSAQFRLLALVSAVLIAGGCSTEPNVATLNGRWGGVGLGVTSGPAGAEIRLPCGIAKLDAPLSFDARGQIDVRSVIDQFYDTYPIRFQASLVRGYLNVTLTEFYSNGDQEVEQFILIPDAKPDFGGVFCLG
jgi:hypothetical protein